jgi:transposase InsO family protein
MFVNLLHGNDLGKEMSMKKQRRKFSAQQKVQMLRQHLVEKVPISEVCDRNGKLERYHRTIKGSCLRVKTPLSQEDAQRVVTEFVTDYNHQRLHSAIGYITPKDKLEGRSERIQAARDVKLTAARETRKTQRQAS